MNTRHILSSILLVGLLSSGSLIAQENNRPNADKKKPLINKDDREKLQAAREAAMQDPNVVALIKQQEFLQNQIRDAVRAAMIKSDPSLQPILEKMKNFDGGKKFGDRGRGKGPFMDGEERAEMKEAMQQVHNDPAVIAAKAKLEAATTPEEKKAAFQELASARAAALAKIDPELAEKFAAFCHSKSNKPSKSGPDAPGDQAP